MSGSQAQPGAAENGTLLVGLGIQVKGQIESCRNLIVEGRVEVTLDAERLEVREEGRFKGVAEVDNAEVAGVLEGTLTVRDLLTVKSGGRVSGRIRYARINIETGGEIAGDIDVEGEATARVKEHVG